MNAQEIVETAKRLWAQATTDDISDENAWQITKNAIEYVEAIDHPKSNTVTTVSGYQFNFGTTPTDVSQWLYVYKTIEFFESSASVSALLDGAAGVTFRRGPDSISTEGASMARSKKLEEYRKEYIKLLRSVKVSAVNAITPSNPDLYQNTDSDFLKVN
jgi:hypothetical protein